MVDSEPEKKVGRVKIENLYIFVGITALLVSYILYTMIRARKGERPGQLAEAVGGLADGCATLGIPVTGGNVSLYNQTGDNAIHPTPVIGVLGVHDDVNRRLAAGFTTDAAQVVLLGATREEFGGSAWAHVIHQHLGGRPPAPDLHAERALATLITTATFGSAEPGGTADGLLASAHDLSTGGLAIALAESCLRGARGCRRAVPAGEYLRPRAPAWWRAELRRAVYRVPPARRCHSLLP